MAENNERQPFVVDLRNIDLRNIRIGTSQLEVTTASSPRKAVSNVVTRNRGQTGLVLSALDTDERGGTETYAFAVDTNIHGGPVGGPHTRLRGSELREAQEYFMAETIAETLYERDGHQRKPANCVGTAREYIAAFYDSRH